MPTPTANLTGNIDAAVGEVLGIQATVRYSDAVWADQTNNTVIVGGGVIPIGADGAVDVDLPQTTEAIRVGIELSYVDNATRQRTKLWSGWRELTADTTFAEFWAFTPESPPLTDGERIAADLTDLDTRVGVLEAAAGEPAPAGGGSLIVADGGAIDLDETLPAGTLVGYRFTAPATVEGTSLAAGSYIFERDPGVYGGWTYRTLATASAVIEPPDTAAPTAGTLSASTTTVEGNLSVSGALDETLLHATPYAFSKDNGATWTGWQASASYQFAGLTHSTSYTFRHKVRDAAGNEKLGTAVTVSTATASSWTTYSAEDFQAEAEGTLLHGLTPNTGSALAVYAGDVKVTTGATSTEAKVIGQAAGTTAATGTWQPAYSIIWTGIPTAGGKGFRATFNYDQTGSTNGWIAFFLPLTSSFSNSVAVGVNANNTIRFDRFGGAAHTATPVASPPTITKVGKCTVEATGTHATQDWIIKVYIDDVLHTTYTMTGSTIYADRCALIHKPEATGVNVSRIKDFVLERSA